MIPFLHQQIQEGIARVASVAERGKHLQERGKHLQRLCEAFARQEQELKVESETVHTQLLRLQQHLHEEEQNEQGKQTINDNVKREMLYVQYENFLEALTLDKEDILIQMKVEMSWMMKV